MEPANLAIEPRSSTGRFVRVAGLVIAWLLLLGGLVALFAPTEAQGHTCHEMPITGDFTGSSPCNKASQDAFVGGLLLIGVGAAALLFLRWRRRRQSTAPQNRPGTLGGIGGFPALTADGTGLLVSSEFLKTPLRIDPSALDLVTFGPIDFGALQQLPSHWGIGPPTRRPVTLLSFVFRSPTRVGPFVRSTSGPRGITTMERRSGLDLDVFQVGVHDPTATATLLTSIGIGVTEDPGPVLRARFGLADAMTLAGRAKLRQSIRRTAAAHLLLVVAALGVRLALTVSDDARTRDIVLGWTAAVLVAAVVGMFGAFRLPPAAQAGERTLREVFAAGAGAGLIGMVVAASTHHPVLAAIALGVLGLGVGACVGLSLRAPARDPKPEWMSPPLATIHDARDPRGERQLQLRRRGAGVMAGVVMVLLLISAIAPTTDRVAVAPRTVSTAGAPASAPYASTIADIGRMVTAFDPVIEEVPADTSVHGGGSLTTKVQPLQSTEWSDPRGRLSIIIESFGSRAEAVKYHQVHTAGDMDDYSSVTLLNPPVEGATSFTCECGDVFVMYLRGETRVFVEVNPPASDPQGTAERLAKQIDLVMRDGQTAPANGA